MVTIYHWDLPAPIQDLGGWTNPAIIDYITDFAKILFEQYGDRVKVNYNTIKFVMILIIINSVYSEPNRGISIFAFKLKFTTSYFIQLTDMDDD